MRSHSATTDRVGSQPAKPGPDRRRPSLALVAGLLAAVLLPYRPAVAGDLPPGKQAIFLARIIAYDANLKSRVGAAVNIGVLARKGDRESERMADQLVKSWKSLETATVLGLPVRASRLWFTGREALDRAVKDGEIDTLYVCSGLDGSLADIKAVARARKVLTMASQESHLKLGLSLGVFEIDGRNTIVVNLEANREEGVAFGPELLRLATVVR
jgi:hypothetical protein